MIDLYLVYISFCHNGKIKKCFWLKMELREYQKTRMSKKK